MSNKFIFIVLTIFVVHTLAHSQDTVNFYFLGNEGILITTSQTRIIIDGIYESGLGTYQDMSKVSESIINKTNRKRNILLISHEHKDHFSKDKIIKFIKTNDECFVISNPTVISLLANNSSFIPLTHDYLLDTLYNDPIENITIKSQYFKHPHKKNSNIKNIVFSISYKGLKISHLGDSDLIEDSFEKQKFLNESDLIFIPFWFLIDEKSYSIIKGNIKYNSIYLIHYPEDFEGWLKKSSNFEPSSVPLILSDSELPFQSLIITD